MGPAVYAQCTHLMSAGKDRPKMKIRTTVTKTTAKKVTIEVDAVTLIEALRANGVKIPGDAKVYVTVPGGGDWSHTDLDIDDDAPLTIEYEEHTEDEETEVVEP